VEIELPVLQDLPKCWSGSPVTVTWAEDGETTTREVWSEPQVQKVAYEYGERCFLAGMEKGRRLASGGGANNYGNASERDSQTDHRTAQCAQDTAEKMASRAGSGDSVRSGESPDIATQHALDIDAMVNHFLAWRLPDDFGPDAGISFTPNPQFPHAWPTGTNLLTAVQARAMFEHCAGGARVGQEWQPIETAPKNGTGILALLPESNFPVGIRFQDGGWHVAWDDYRLGELDQPQWWMWCPGMPGDSAAPTPETPR
jgi:hypothetical protein